MAGLQRSVETFRRSGSSGLVWEDKFLSELTSNMSKKEEAVEEIRRDQLIRSSSDGTIRMMTMERSRSINKDAARPAYHTGKVSPAVDPPSPKLSGCGFCGIFGNPGPAKGSKPVKPRRRR